MGPIISDPPRLYCTISLDPGIDTSCMGVARCGAEWAKERILVVHLDEVARVHVGPEHLRN